MPMRIDAAVRERARLFADHRRDYPSDTALAEAVPACWEVSQRGLLSCLVWCR
jgi:hypothetical protein